MSSSSDTRDQTVLCAISETQWFVSWTISCSKKEVKKMWNTAYEMVTPVSSSCLHSSFASKLCSCCSISNSASTQHGSWLDDATHDSRYQDLSHVCRYHLHDLSLLGVLPRSSALHSICTSTNAQCYWQCASTVNKQWIWLFSMHTRTIINAVYHKCVQVIIKINIKLNSRIL